MTDFTVYHSSLQDDNDALNAAVRQTYTILQDLNSSLTNMNTAAQGKAFPLWQAQQNSWNTSYDDMATRLSGSATASDNVAQIFLDGDNATARIMS